MMLKSLFQTGYIGKLKLQNRIIMAPMGTMLGNIDSTVSDQICRYYEERARGGTGMITVEYGTVAPNAGVNPRLLGAYDDRFIPGLERLAKSIHRHDCRASLEINHSGRGISAEAAGGQPVGPSAIANPVIGVVPRALTTGEVEQMVEDYAEAARRAKEAGFDAVEFHGAHGYLIAQFLSTSSNKRTDKYGGDPRGRATIVLEIIARTKEKVGPDFPLLVRLSADEGIPYGITIDETLTVARLLQAAGVNCLDISAGTFETSWKLTIQTGHEPRGCLVPYAEKVKQVVSIPVSVAGRINDPVLANDIIKQGKSDFVSIGRGLIADPDFAEKSRNGKVQEVRKCTACMYCIDMVAGAQKSICCAVNATAGREGESALPKTTRRKKVLVVGGGPGGMEASRVARLHGHDVTLIEHEMVLGGQLNLASIAPGKGEIANTVSYFNALLPRLKVKIKTSKEPTIQYIKKMKPDAVVMATGSTTPLPNVEGIELPHVILARDAIKGKINIGQTVVVVGSGRIGCETALILASSGISVTLIGGWPGKLGGASMIISRSILVSDLRKVAESIEADSLIEKIVPEGVVVNRGGQIALIKADTVVLSPLAFPNNNLELGLRDIVPEVYIIGDAVEPRCIADATREGFEVGCHI